MSCAVFQCLSILNDSLRYYWRLRIVPLSYCAWLAPTSILFETTEGPCFWDCWHIWPSTPPPPSPTFYAPPNFILNFFRKWKLLNPAIVQIGGHVPIPTHLWMNVLECIRECEWECRVRCECEFTRIQQFLNMLKLIGSVTHQLSHQEHFSSTTPSPSSHLLPSRSLPYCDVDNFLLIWLKLPNWLSLSHARV